VGITSSTALWYASRATGVVALVLLTAVALMGIMVSRQGRLPGLPRFATTSLHRSLALLAVVFIAIHVLTAIVDPFVTIGIAAVFIPFTSPYKPLWLGLGAVSLDIIVALVGTSLLRGRIGRRTWRAVHWLAYLCWPVALAHSIGSATDLRTGWLLSLTIGCCIAVVAAVAWRIIAAALTPGPAQRPARALARVGSAVADRRPGLGPAGNAWPGNDQRGGSRTHDGQLAADDRPGSGRPGDDRRLTGAAPR